MRTTVAIDDKLLAAARRRARQLDLTLGELIEEALRRELARAANRSDAPAIPVFRGGGGLKPGVDATSTRALLEELDRGRPVQKLR